MVRRVQVRPISNDEGNKLLRIVRRSSGSVVTWRRAQMVLLSAQGMAVPQIAEVTFTSADRVRGVIHNFNADGFDSLRPKYAGGRPPKFTVDQRQEIKKAALRLSRPSDHGLPFSVWSLSKLADFLVAEGVVDDISHEGLRTLLRKEGVSFPNREDLEDQHRSRLRGQEEPGAGHQHVEPGDHRGLEEARRLRGERAQPDQLVEGMRLQHEIADVDCYMSPEGAAST